MSTRENIRLIARAPYGYDGAAGTLKLSLHFQQLIFPAKLH